MPVVIIQPLKSNVVNANEQLVIAAGIQVLPGQNISLLRNQTTYYWDVVEVGLLYKLTHSIDPERLKAPPGLVTQPLNLKCDILVSSLCFFETDRLVCRYAEGVLEFDFPEKLATPRTNANLVVRKNVLAAGQTYLLRLTAINTVSGLTGFDEVSFVVNGAPSSGTFDVTPSVGFAGETVGLCTAVEFSLPVALESAWLQPLILYVISL